MIARVLAEARDLPLMAPYHDYWRGAAEVLAEPWPGTAREMALLKAGLALALSFDTWRLLVRGQGLSDGQAVGFMMRLTCDCAPG